MPLRVRTIRARQFAVSEDVLDLVELQLGPNRFSGEMVRTMADYPPQMSTVSGYRRGGDLGRGWRMSRLIRDGHGIFAEVENRVKYTGRVQGRKRGRKGPGTQTREMKRRKWLSIDDGVKRVWPKHRAVIVRIFNQRDPRVRRRRKRSRAQGRGMR